MYIEFVLYVFIIVGFLGGVLRGVKKEFFALVALLASLALVIFTYKPLIEAVTASFNLKEAVYDIGVVNAIFSTMGITYLGFEYLLFAGVPFLLCFIILTITYKGLIFNAKRAAQGKAKSGSKFLGGIVGLISGLVVGLFMIPLFATIFKEQYPATPIDAYKEMFNGYIVPFIMQDIPFLSEKLQEIVRQVGVLIG